MEQAIDKNDIDGQLETLLKKVFTSYRNRTAYKHFLEVTKDLKPQKCMVKTGWRAGKYISIYCKFTKNGNGDIFKEIIKGWTNKLEDLYFLYGLYPEIFHFDPLFILEESECFHLSFKLQKTK